MPRPRLVAVADTVPASRQDAVARLGFERAYADWRDLVADPDVRAVSVTAPNALHREIGVAVAEAGKHLWIEKPVGLTAGDAEAVADAVAWAGTASSVGFNYRTAPAVARARVLLAEGAIGRPTHARFRLLTDYAAHPAGARSWRFQRAHGGAGVLADLVSHGVDLVRFLLGDIERLVADTATFIARRPVAEPGAGHYALAAADAELADVENEDFLTCLLRTRGGVLVHLESSRVSVGDQNSYGFEIHGTQGILAWDFRRMGELGVSSGELYADQPMTTVFVGPGDGEYAAFQPGAGIAMGYDDLKVVEAAGFLRAVAGAPSPLAPTAEDAVHSARALEAMQRSAAEGRWVVLA